MSILRNHTIYDFQSVIFSFLILSSLYKYFNIFYYTSHWQSAFIRSCMPFRWVFICRVLFFAETTFRFKDYESLVRPNQDLGSIQSMFTAKFFKIKSGFAYGSQPGVPGRPWTDRSQCWSQIFNDNQGEKFWSSPCASRWFLFLKNFRFLVNFLTVIDLKAKKLFESLPVKNLITSGPTNELLPVSKLGQKTFKVPFSK